MKTFSILLISICLVWNLFCQKYPYREYTTYDGLAQMQINCLFQDSRGYLWIGTKGGLSKFNGETFKSFRSPDGLPGSFVSDINEDREGNIWIGFRKEGVARYDGKTFTHYKINESRGNNLIEIDHKNRVWVFAASPLEAQILLFDGEGFVAANQLITALGNIELTPTGKYDEMHKRMLFYSESLGLIIALEDGNIYPIEGLEGEFKGFPWRRGLKGPVSVLSFLANGKSYINNIVGDRCIKIFEFKRSAHTNIFFPIDDDKIIYHNSKEIFHVDVKTGAEKLINEWNVSWFRYILYDRAGNLWIATENGLIQHYGEMFREFTDSLPTFVWSIVEDKNNDIWFASYGFGLFKFDGKSFSEELNYKKLFPDAEFYTGAILDKYKNIIFPTSKGVLQYDGAAFEWLDHGVSGNSPQFIYEDKERELFFTAVRFGFRIIDRNGLISQYGQEEGIHANDYILCISKDKNGLYWFSSDYGLSRFDLDSETFENYTSYNGNLPSSGVLSIYKDYKDNMWFGARDGLLTLDYLTGKIRKVAETEITSRVSFIIDVDQQHLLIGTLEGLFLFNLQKYYNQSIIELKLYSKNNGYPGIQPIQNGAFKDSKGYIWIPARNGVCRLDPKKLNFEENALKTYFTEINGQEIGFYQDSIIVELPYNINEVKISFEAIGFSRPQATQYAYRLVEQNSDWSSWQEEDYVLLTGLNSGTHHFEVKSRIIGISHEKTTATRLLITIDLPFWNEPDFYIYALIIMVLLTGLLFYNYLRQRSFRLRALQNERENRYLKIQTLQAQMNPHFVFNVLGTLQYLILKSDTLQANRHLVSLSDLIRQFLDSSVKSNTPAGSSTENEISLEKEIELIRMYIDFERLHYGEAFEYELLLDQQADPSTQMLPPMLIQPYVENAIKHGLLPKKEKGKLSINFTIINEILICMIQDNGIGRKKSMELQKKSLRPYKSHGTNLVKSRVMILNEMGYNINIKTEDGEEGTIVTITIGV